MISAENLFAPELLSREMQVKIREFRLLPAPEMLLFSDREAQEMFIYSHVWYVCVIRSVVRWFIVRFLWMELK